MQRVEPVTVMVSRKVRPGKAPEYEAWIRGVTDVAATYTGFLGMNVFAPDKPDAPYVFVYKFDSGEHLDAWLGSDVRAQWVKRAEELTTETKAEHVSGLESWFTLPGASAMVPPPRWKMALVTGTAVWIMGLALQPIMHRALGALPQPVVALASTAVMVSLLTWVVMPRLTRLLARWLFTRRSG